MRVAVTGAGGFIGRNLSAHLVERGYAVTAVVRSPEARRKLERLGVSCHVGDVTDPASLEAPFKEQEAVIHLAAYFNRPDASYEDYERVNVTGARNVAQRAHAAGVGRLVHASTIGVAVGAGSPPFDESTPYSPPPSDAYESTKASGEQAVIACHRESGLPLVVIRPAQVYGPGDVSKAKFYKLVKRGVIVRPGRTLRHMVHVLDLARAFELALTTPHCHGDVYIIANEEPILLSELVELAARELGVRSPRVRIPATPVVAAAAAVERLYKALGRRPPIHRRSMDFFTRSVAFRTARARDELGFRPVVPLEQGIAETIRWYRENGIV